MNVKLREKIFYAASILAFAAGIFSTITAMRNTTDTIAFANRGQRSYTRLQALLDAHHENRAIIELIETALEKAQPSLASLTEPYAFEKKPEIRERTLREVYPPYFMREAQVIFKDAPLKDIASFINAAERLPMPWMLSEYHATATGAEPGVANVIAILRTITHGETPEFFSGTSSF